jgi:HSP20 family protein
MLQNWNPWQELEDVQRRLSRSRGEDMSGTWAPATDIVEDTEGLYIYLDLPDVDEGSLDVSTEQTSLSVRATRHYRKDENQTIHYQGRPKGEFSRSFSIPTSFDLSKVEGSYERGVLTLHIPRSESTKPRKVAVKMGGGEAEQVSGESAEQGKKGANGRGGKGSEE